MLEFPQAQALFRSTEGANGLEMSGSCVVDVLKVCFEGEVPIKNNPEEPGRLAGLNNLPIT
jgi:hypothetical protein